MSKLSRNLSTLYSKLCISKRKSSFLLLMVARLVYWLHLFLSQAKRNPRAADPPVDNSKNPHFLVLISENFMEARAALSRPGVANLAPNQNPVKMDIAPVTSVTGPAPTSIPSGFLFNDSALFFATSLSCWPLSVTKCLQGLLVLSLPYFTETTTHPIKKWQLDFAYVNRKKRRLHMHQSLSICCLSLGSLLLFV